MEAESPNHIECCEKSLRKVIQAASLKSRLGAFLFPPSLATYVGQDYEALAECLDPVSPMMYTSGAGAACLNTEVLCLVTLLARLGKKIPQDKILQACYERLGIHEEDLPRTIQELEREDLPPQIIKREIRASRLMLGRGSALVPNTQRKPEPTA